MSKFIAACGAALLLAGCAAAPEDIARTPWAQLSQDEGSAWMVPQLIREADLGSRDADDSPVRLVLAFDGDRSRFSPRDSLLNELARTLTGEEMPYAALMYVWCNRREPGTIVKNLRTDRIRTLVLESGAHW